MCRVGVAGDGSNYPPRCARAADAALGLAAYFTHDISKTKYLQYKLIDIRSKGNSVSVHIGIRIKTCEFCACHFREGLTTTVSMTFHFFPGLSRHGLPEIYGGDSGLPSAVLINSLSNYIYAAPVDAL